MTPLFLVLSRLYDRFCFLPFVPRPSFTPVHPLFLILVVCMTPLLSMASSVPFVTHHLLISYMYILPLFLIFFFILLFFHLLAYSFHCCLLSLTHVTHLLLPLSIFFLYSSSFLSSIHLSPFGLLNYALLCDFLSALLMLFTLYSCYYPLYLFFLNTFFLFTSFGCLDYSRSFSLLYSCYSPFPHFLYFYSSFIPQLFFLYSSLPFWLAELLFTAFCALLILLTFYFFYFYSFFISYLYHLYSLFPFGFLVYSPLCASLSLPYSYYSPFTHFLSSILPLYLIFFIFLFTSFPLVGLITLLSPLLMLLTPYSLFDLHDLY